MCFWELSCLATSIQTALFKVFPLCCKVTNFQLITQQIMHLFFNKIFITELLREQREDEGRTGISRQVLRHKKTVLPQR